MLNVNLVQKTNNVGLDVINFSKTNKSDFYSENNNTFLGHYNYYVITKELYNEVKNQIPDYIRVYIDGKTFVKKVKKLIM